MAQPEANDLLKTIHQGSQYTHKGDSLKKKPAESEAIVPTVLAPEDEEYLRKLIAAIRAGKRAVLVVEESDDKLKYMFSNASRAESVCMLGKVLESTGRRLAQGDD